MPQRDDGTPPPSPTVRRASVLPAVAAGPGSGLEQPLEESGASTAAAEAAEAPTVGGEPANSAGPDGETTPAGTTAPETDIRGTPATETHAPEVPPPAASEPELPAVVNVPSAAPGTADPEAGRTATDGDGTPSGRPDKPLLAAAAIAGTVLVGVPFLFLGLGSDDDPSSGAGRPQAAGGTFLQDGPAAAQGGDPYAAASPERRTRTMSPAAPAKSDPATVRSRQPRTSPKPSTTPPPSPSGGSGRTGKASAPPVSVAGTGRYLPQGANFRTTSEVLIKNVMTGLCVDVPNYGKGTVDGPVNQFTCRRTGDNQLWDLVVSRSGAGPSGADLFTIRNSKDGYCLDLPYYDGRAAGTKVSEYHCDGTTADNQLWYLDKKSEGKFWIRNYSSGNRCLDVDGYYGVGGKDARLTIFDCDLKDDHLWSFS